MKAKEMFKELGYKKINDKEDIIQYFNKKDNVRIRFFETAYGNSIEIEDDCYMATFIGIKELQAINKQVEELGWNDEI